MILLYGIEARALLGGIEIPMPDDQCFRELSVQLLQLLTKGKDLFRRSGIDLTSRRVQTTLIADADGVLVVPVTVRTNLLDRPSGFDAAVAPDDEVIPDALPVVAVPVLPLLVPFVDVGGRALLSRTDSRAMNNDKRDMAHTIAYRKHNSLMRPLRESAQSRRLPPSVRLSTRGLSPSHRPPWPSPDPPRSAQSPLVIV